MKKPFYREKIHEIELIKPEKEREAIVNDFIKEHKEKRVCLGNY